MRETYGDDNIILVDCDPRVGGTKKAYPNAMVINLQSDAGRMKLAELGETGKHILVDFAGGSMTEIQELMKGAKSKTEFFDLYKDYGYEVNVIIPFTSELNSQLAIRDIHAAYGDGGVNVNYYFAKNLKGTTDENVNLFFEGFDGTLSGIENHPYLKDYCPRDFAIENMGLDTLALDEVGTTSNLFEIPQMFGTLSIWVHDASKFNGANPEFSKMKPMLRNNTIRYFDEIRARLMTTNLLK
jgi:hypothetical protein